MCDFCRRGISITLFYPSHNVAHNLLRRQFYSNKQNCLFSSKCKMKIKFFILKCQLSIFHNLGQMRCPENQYLSENASSCKSCFWNFCNYVCLADFPVYCPFSQQPTWFWIFFLFVVARIFLYFWKFCVFRGYFCLFLILKLLNWSFFSVWFVDIILTLVLFMRLKLNKSVVKI